MNAKIDSANFCTTLWSDRMKDLDSYAKWAEISNTERQKLFDDVFDKDHGLFHV